MNTVPLTRHFATLMATFPLVGEVDAFLRRSRKNAAGEGY